MSAPLHIFIASPYTAPCRCEKEANVNRSLYIATRLLEKGHQPFAPLLSHYWDEFAAWGLGRDISYERWLSWCLSWVEQCQALYYLAPSPGADRELARAEELGLLVFRALEDVPCVDVDDKGNL